MEWRHQKKKESFFQYLPILKERKVNQNLNGLNKHDDDNDNEKKKRSTVQIGMPKM